MNRWPFEPPVLSQSQADALGTLLSGGGTGAQVWNTSTNRLEEWNGATWQPVGNVVSDAFGNLRGSSSDPSILGVQNVAHLLSAYRTATGEAFSSSSPAVEWRFDADGMITYRYSINAAVQDVAIQWDAWQVFDLTILRKHLQQDKLVLVANGIPDLSRTPVDNTRVIVFLGNVPAISKNVDPDNGWYNVNGQIITYDAARGPAIGPGTDYLVAYALYETLDP